MKRAINGSPFSPLNEQEAIFMDVAVNQISYFGYGSLVNEDTLQEGTRVIPGRLSGWVREWRGCARWRGKEHAGMAGVCALGVRRKQGAHIRGVMVLDRKDNLPWLDDREWHYDRNTLEQGSFAPDASAHVPEDTFMYAIKDQHYFWGNDDYPILLSYLDCVLAGFDRLWGEAGVRHFFETTEGWDRVPVLNDRGDKIYPRAVTISKDLEGRIDSLLQEFGARHLNR
ncbi:gamma-glutamylcyclotransferase family protein [Pseudovibrio sp. SPO723]|uniref:gamma-glutamylcyclotransferase family protein n=1 Tax=Nesiotobacter zosterae TaxID=392721 RepID=UPI0029C9F298|nr:gamma-glutamylcyclotransferase family protein [Pseudovibrio sp. SPO723]